MPSRTIRHDASGRLISYIKPGVVIEACNFNSNINKLSAKKIIYELEQIIFHLSIIFIWFEKLKLISIFILYTSNTIHSFK